MTTNNAVNFATTLLDLTTGGTGQTTATAAFNALSPLTTKGDLIVYTTTNARLGVGADGQVFTADSVQASGTKWAAAATVPVIKSSSTVLTSAQIKAVRATPITVLAASGAGTINVPLSVVLKLTYAGTNVFTNGQTVAIKYTDGAGNAATAASSNATMITSASSAYTYLQCVTGVDMSAVENSLLCIHNIGASEITGNAANDNTLTVVLTYVTLTM